MADDEVMRIELPDGRGEDLVRELDLLELDSVQAVEDDGTVKIAVPRNGAGEAQVLEPLVAVEGWLARSGIDAAEAVYGGERHRLRPRDQDN